MATFSSAATLTDSVMSPVNAYRTACWSGHHDFNGLRTLWRRRSGGQVCITPLPHQRHLVGRVNRHDTY